MWTLLLAFIPYVGVVFGIALFFIPTGKMLNTIVGVKVDKCKFDFCDNDTAEEDLCDYCQEWLEMDRQACGKEHNEAHLLYKKVCGL